VPRELIERVMDAARWAPSAVNMQPWQFVVLTDPERRRALAKSTGIAGVVLQSHVAEAPVLIALCGDERRSSWYIHDCCLASQNLMLAATALGLGTCWIGLFDEAKVWQALGLSEGMRVVGLITLGYPLHEYQPPTPRLPLDSIVHWECFSRGDKGGRTKALRQRGMLSLWRKMGDFLRFSRN
jgi:nitroreductase